MKAIVDNYSKEELENIVKNSSSMREVIKKLGYKTISGGNSKTIAKRLIDYNISTNHFNANSVEKVERNESNIFIKDSTASQSTLRRWYLKGNYTEYKCSICGQKDSWNGNPLTLILDHINGSNHDNRLENLRWVCPNCNQQLETTGFSKMQAQKLNKTVKKYYCKKCGKEITKNTKTELCRECYDKSKRFCNRPNKKELKKMIREMPFTKIAEIYLVSDNAVRKWCDSYDLPRKKTEINKYTDEEWNSL